MTLKLGVLQSEDEGRRMVMRSLSVAQAKAHLSALLDALESGEDLEISRRGIHVERLMRPDQGVRILATLRNLAINAVRLDGIWLITKGIGALSHDIKGLLWLMGWREPAEAEVLGKFLIGLGVAFFYSRRSPGGLIASANEFHLK